MSGPRLILPDSISSSSFVPSNAYCSNNLDSNTPPTPSSPNSSKDAAVIFELCSRLSKVEGENKVFEQHISKEKELITSITKLNNISRIIILFLPLAQLLVIACLTYFLKDSTNMLKVIYGIIGVMGAATIFELLYIPKRMSELEKRINEIEERGYKPLDKIAEVLTGDKK